MPPVKPLLDAFDAETMQMVAVAFAEELSAYPTTEMGVLLGTGTKG